MAVREKRRAAAALVAAAALLFVGTTVHALLGSPGELVLSRGIAHSHENEGGMRQGSAPKRLIIPSIGVSARVEQVGLTESGAMQAPYLFADVSWYREGTLPGEPGSAVFAGHVDNGLSLPGVFKKLDEVEPGDRVYVVLESGERIAFIVESTEEYPYDATPTEVLFSSSGAPRLTLITCAGDWVRSGGTYDRRLVITAALVS